jgi:nucleotide-binding universal stress UspA family protein
LLALDGSPAAQAALPTARTLAGQLGSTLEIVHVGPTELQPPELRARLHLTDQGGLRLGGRVGDPAREILSAAAEPDVALVVLTTHGHEIDGPKGLTSVAAGVIAATTRPLLLVRPEAALRARVAPLQRFLVPLDGDPRTAGALGPALELVSRLGRGWSGRIDVLMVAYPRWEPSRAREGIGPPRYVDQAQHEWPAWRRTVRTWLRACCGSVADEIPIRVFLLPGLDRRDAGTAVAAFAGQHAEDAIILVRRSHLETGRAPILRQVLGLTPCPVLLVPGPANPGRDPGARGSAGYIPPAPHRRAG